MHDLLGHNRFGYIAAGPRSQFDTELKDRFGRQGILVVEFPIDRIAFKDEVRRAHKKHVEAQQAPHPPRIIIDLFPARNISKKHFKKRR